MHLVRVRVRVRVRVGVRVRALRSPLQFLAHRAALVGRRAAELLEQLAPPAAIGTQRSV